jgi:ribose transport system ATP-binding protein
VAHTPSDVPLFEISGIKKAFGAVRALDWDDRAKIKIKPGEVWAFAGENGAGKSTLAAILAGVTKKDGGTVQYGDAAYAPASISAAQALGVQIVFQEPALIPSLTVAENIFIRQEKQFRWLIFQNRQRMIAKARRLLSNICPHIDPATVARDLSLEDQKLVETARAVSMGPRCVIFDETTAAMSSQNTALLIELITRVKKAAAVILVTHRTKEIFELTDKILVLKDGKYVGVRITRDTTPEELSALMVGRNINLNMRSSQLAFIEGHAKPLLEAKNLSVNGGVQNFSLRLERGAIVGIGGLAGAGHESVLRALYGLVKCAAGEVLIKGRPYSVRNPRRSIRKGISYSPKNRDREGLILRHKVRENAVLSVLGRLSIRGFTPPSREMRLSTTLSKHLQIKCRSVEDICQNLSGGNRQKVVLAKLLATEGDIFLLDNPTRGIDIGARAEIYQLMNKLTASGAGIIMASDELQELLQMSDTILIVRDGHVSKVFNRDENPSESDLIRHMI